MKLEDLEKLGKEMNRINDGIISSIKINRMTYDEWLVSIPKVLEQKDVIPSFFGVKIIIDEDLLFGEAKLEYMSGRIENISMFKERI